MKYSQHSFGYFSVAGKSDSGAPSRVLSFPGRLFWCDFRSFQYLPHRLAFLLLLLTLFACNRSAFAQTAFTTTAVGSTTTSPVTVTLTSGAAVVKVEVFSEGVLSTSLTSPEFEIPASASSTCVVASGSGSTCQQSVTFSPVYPGMRIGAVVLLDSSNTVIGEALLYGIGKGGLGVFSPGEVAPIAGVLTQYKDLQLDFNAPSDVVVDGAGNLYVADTTNNRIRKVAAVSGQITSASTVSTFAGTGSSGYSGDGGLATSATLNEPYGLAIDGAGNIYIADTGNNRVRRVDAITGYITTVAGTGNFGYFGDGAVATSAELYAPQGVTVDFQGNLYIADTNNNCIRKVAAVSSQITSASNISTVVGTGTAGFLGDNGTADAAKLNAPNTVAFDSSGNMYIPDSGNNRIRLVTASSGVISTFAGDGSTSVLHAPSGVAVDAANNVYIADTGNKVIRVVSTQGATPATYIAMANKYLTGTVLGTYDLYGPNGIALDGNGDLFFADTYNMVISEMYSNQAVLDFTGTVVRQGSKSSPINQSLANRGNDTLSLSTIHANTNADLDSLTTCVESGSLAVNGSCTLGAVFAPALTPALSGNTQLIPTITVADYSNTSITGSNSPLTVDLVGEASAVNSTTTTVTSTPEPSNYGDRVTFTIGVVTGTGTLSGTVNLYDTFGGTLYTRATGLTVSTSGVTGTATYRTSTLGIGIHSIYACYVPSSTDAHSASCSTDNSTPAYSQTVNETTSLALTSSANPVMLGNGITLTATVSISGNGGSVTPTGMVDFTLNGTITLCSAVNLVSNQATCPVLAASLSQGYNTITATYSGNSSQVLGVTSNTITEDVQAQSALSIVPSSNPASYGSPVSFTATITPGGAAVAATGTVSILKDGATLSTPTLSGNVASYTTSSLTVGTHTITASYGGDEYNSSATASGGTLTITKADTQTALVSPGTVIAGARTFLSATVKMVSGSLIPTGTVTFSDGSTTLGTATLNSSGTATLTGLVFSAGTHSIVVSYAGDSNDNASASSTNSLVVQQATTQTAVTLSSATIAVDGPVQITATVTGNGGTPTGTVTFYSNGSAIGTATLGNSATATLSYTATVVGTDSITAIYGGDTNDVTSTSSAVTLTVILIPTTTAIGVASTDSSNEETILAATVINTDSSSAYPSPTGTVTFTTGTTTLGTSTLSSSGVATLTPSLSNGIYTIKATYSGDTQHKTSTATLSNVVGVGNYTISLTPSSLSMKASQNSTVTVVVTSANSFTDTIVVGCSSLPANVSCTFDKSGVVLAAGGSQTFQLTVDTNNPLSGGSSAANRRMGRKSSVLLSGIILPLSLLMGWMLYLWRRRNGGLIASVLLVLVPFSSLLIGGCSGISYSSATPGTYQIEVTVNGASTGVSHYQTLTLTITK